MFLFPRVCRRTGCFSTEMELPWPSHLDKEYLGTRPCWLTGTALPPRTPSPTQSTSCWHHQVGVNYPQATQAQHPPAGLHRAGVGRGEECACPAVRAETWCWTWTCPRTASPEGWWTLRGSDWCSARTKQKIKMTILFQLLLFVFSMAFVCCLLHWSGIPSSISCEGRRPDPNLKFNKQETAQAQNFIIKHPKPPYY